MPHASQYDREYIILIESTLIFIKVKDADSLVSGPWSLESEVWSLESRVWSLDSVSYHTRSLCAMLMVDG